MLLLRRIGAAREDDKALVLRTLWPRPGLVTIFEYESPVGSSFRPGDLLRLWSYGAVHDAAHIKELPGPSELTLVLVLPSVTPTLIDEIARMKQQDVTDQAGHDEMFLNLMEAMPLEKRLAGLAPGWPITDACVSRSSKAPRSHPRARLYVSIARWTSSVPQSSLHECMLSIGPPTSTVAIPSSAAVIGPIVVPHGRSLRVTNRCA